MLSVELTGGDVLQPGGLAKRSSIAFEAGVITGRAARQVDVAGFTVLPGLVDVHGDGFEKHVAPRRGAMKDVATGLRAAEAEIAANGITTGVIAQFISWEGGLRGPDFAAKVFTELAAVNTLTDLRGQMRLEAHLIDLYDKIYGWMAAWNLSYIVFNDHLPHERLAQGRRPKGLEGQALKAGRSPQSHLALLQDLHARRDEVPAALDRLCAELRASGLRLGSHDDRTAQDRARWAARGVEVAEFPETLQAAEAPGLVVLGAPNVMRGGSHKGNMSALDAVMMGYCDALASDYHYPSLLRAALFLRQTLGLEAAWDLVSSGPARVLGLADRGRLSEGLRADLVILDDQERVAGTISGGRISFLRGDLAERFAGTG